MPTGTGAGSFIYVIDRAIWSDPAGSRSNLVGRLRSLRNAPVLVYLELNYTPAPSKCSIKTKFWPWVDGGIDN